LGIVCFYGAGVVLIREITQRLRLSAWGVVLLGCAFAPVEEGLALQTIFNPIGMDGEAVYGNAFGVNWFWAVVVSGYHVVWSVLIPIAVVHLAFPHGRRSPWVSRRAAGALTAVFACGTAIFVVISLLRSDFRLSWVQAAATIVVTAGLILAATTCKDRDRAASAARAPGRMVVGLFGLVAGIGWFVLFLAAFIGGPSLVRVVDRRGSVVRGRGGAGAATVDRAAMDAATPARPLLWRRDVGRALRAAAGRP
jgi:uncharacterized membrane protein